MRERPAIVARTVPRPYFEDSGSYKTGCRVSPGGQQRGRHLAPGHYTIPKRFLRATSIASFTNRTPGNRDARLRLFNQRGFRH